MAKEETGLFIRSNWQPDSHDIPMEFKARVSFFVKQVGTLFKKRIRATSSFLPSQYAAYNWLRNNPNFINFPTDKNLGPAIIERERYIRIAFDEHLSDSKTYRQLDLQTTNNRVNTIRLIINQLIKALKDIGSFQDAKYLLRSTQVKDPFPYLYLLAKVHKLPLKTRPIISASGSLLYGLGRWVDKCLQVLCNDLPYKTKVHLSL